MGNNSSISESNRVFHAIDRDGDGFISPLELKEYSEQHFHIRSGEELYRSIDTNKDGKITLSEFTTFCQRRENELRDAYTKLGADAKQGTLTSVKLRHGLSSLGLKATDKEIERFIQALDTNHDGFVTFEEFRRNLIMIPLENPRAYFDYFVHANAPVEYAQSEYTSPIERESFLHPFSSASASASASLLLLLSPSTTKLLCGGVAGIASRTGTAPMDRLKVMMQAGGVGAPTGLIAGMRSIYANGGLGAFFKGNGVNCVKIAPEMGIKMWAFDYFKVAMAKDPIRITAEERFAAGGAAGALAQTVVYPLETIKTRLALSSGLYRGAYHSLETIITQEGVRALYRGMSTSIIGVVPFAGIDLFINSTLKDKAAEHYARTKQEPGLLVLLGSGMVSSSVAMCVTFPIASIRVRLQAQGLPGHGEAGATARPLNALEVARTILAKDGIGGFYKGVTANLLKVMPSAALSYGVYGELIKYAGLPK